MKRLLHTLSITIAAVVFATAYFHLSFLKNTTITPVVNAQTTSDWPMFMHDPQHTGSTTSSFNGVIGTTKCHITSTQDVSPCIQVRWQKTFDEWTNGLAQPVIVGSTVYLTSMSGKLYAFDTETGTQRWVFDAGNAIYVTSAVVNGKVFFGDFSGKIYALNASTGQSLWSVQTGDRIMSSPVVFTENSMLKVMIGSNDGKLYALNGDSGSILFTAQSDVLAPIISNPAYYNGTVFFAAEDMKAYAIDSTTGQLKWKKTLSGEMNRHNNPIVLSASNTVLFYSVSPHQSSGMGLKDRYFPYQLTGGHGTPDGSAERPLDQLLPAYQTAVLADGGKTKSMFLFSTTNGQEVTNFTVGSQALSMIPLNNWYSNGQNYPVVANNQDLIFSAFGGYVKLNTSSKVFTQLYNSQFIRGDEYNGLTLANGKLYGGFFSNIASLDITSQAVTQLHGCKDCGDPPPYQSIVAPGNTPHWTGNTGDGYTDNGQFFVVANGHGYHFSNGTFYAF